MALFRRRLRSIEEQCGNHIRIGKEFSRQANRHLLEQGDRPAGFIGYNTGCLETLQLFSDWGLPTVVDQIDPARDEDEIVRLEAEKWPGWQAVPGRVPDIYFDRLAAEWKLASRVVVNSDWCRRALVRQGVPDHKLVVIPLAYEAPEDPALPRPEPTGLLTVLWLGLVILRKGIQYLLEAARQLNNHQVRFIVAGPIGISSSAVATAPPNVTFVGPISRDRIAEIYRQADIFVLPTLSDGFAITQLEAMAHGLPVITTSNCGDVVTDAVDGRIVSAADALSLAAAIANLDQDRGLLREMSVRALAKSRQFTLQHLATSMEAVISQLPTANGSGSDYRLSPNLEAYHGQ
jgi:glycosyltransferase involved in cell wall biosynthesis